MDVTCVGQLVDRRLRGNSKPLHWHSSSVHRYTSVAESQSHATPMPQAFELAPPDQSRQMPPDLGSDNSAASLHLRTWSIGGSKDSTAPSRLADTGLVPCLQPADLSPKGSLGRPAMRFVRVMQRNVETISNPCQDSLRRSGTKSRLPDWRATNVWMGDEGT